MIINCTKRSQQYNNKHYNSNVFHAPDERHTEIIHEPGEYTNGCIYLDLQSYYYDNMWGHLERNLKEHEVIKYTNQCIARNIEPTSRNILNHWLQSIGSKPVY